MTTPLPFRSLETTPEEHLLDHDLLHAAHNAAITRPVFQDRIAPPFLVEGILEASFAGPPNVFPTTTPTGWRFLRNGVPKAPSDTDWGAFGQTGWTYANEYGPDDRGRIKSNPNLYSSVLKTDGTYTYAVEFDFTPLTDSNLMIAFGQGQTFEGDDQELRQVRVYLNDVEIESQRRTGMASPPTTPSYIKGVTTTSVVAVAAAEPLVVPLSTSGGTATARIEIRVASTHPSPPAPSFNIGRIVIALSDVQVGTFVMFDAQGFYPSGIREITNGLEAVPVEPPSFKRNLAYRIYGYYNTGLPISNLTYRTPYVMKPDYVRRVSRDENGNQVQEDAVAVPNEFGPSRVGLTYDISTGDVTVLTGKYRAMVYMDVEGLATGDIIELTVDNFGWDTKHYWHYSGVAAPSPQFYLPSGFANGSDFRFTLRVLNGAATGASTIDLTWFEFTIEEAA